MTRASDCLKFLEARPSLGIKLFSRFKKGELETCTSAGLAKTAKVPVTIEQIEVLKEFILEDCKPGSRHTNPDRLFERYKEKQRKLYWNAKRNGKSGEDFYKPELNKELLMQHYKDDLLSEPESFPLTTTREDSLELQTLNFTHEYSKLKRQRFTTIRRYDRYEIGQILFLQSPQEEFYVKVMHKYKDCFRNLSNTLIFNDTDCTTRDEALALFNSFYRKPLSVHEELTVLALERVGVEKATQWVLSRSGKPEVVQQELSRSGKLAATISQSGSGKPPGYVYAYYKTSSAGHKTGPYAELRLYDSKLQGRKRSIYLGKVGTARFLERCEKYKVDPQNVSEKNAG